MTDVFKTIFDYLDEVLRHIFPGLVAVILAYLSRQTDMATLVASANTDTLKLGLVVLILVIGNMVYVIHRTLVHQLIDCAVWVCTKRGNESYPQRVAKMIQHHFSEKECIRKNIRLKNSQIILTAITGELMLVAIYFSDGDSKIGRHPIVFSVVGILLLGGAFCAHYISQKSVLELVEMP